MRPWRANRQAVAGTEGANRSRPAHARAPRRTRPSARVPSPSCSSLNRCAADARPTPLKINPTQALDTTPPIGRETYPSYRLYHFHCEFKRFDELAVRVRAAPFFCAPRAAGGDSRGGVLGSWGRTPPRTPPRAPTCRAPPGACGSSGRGVPRPPIPSLLSETPRLRRCAVGGRCTSPCASLAAAAWRGAARHGVAWRVELLRSPLTPWPANRRPSPALPRQDLAAPPLHLGLWLPPGFDPAKTRPAVVYVHSGGWQAGTINEIYTHFSGLGGPNGLIEGLQNTTDPDNAPVLVAVTYRLTSAGWLYGADNVVWPAQLHDVMDAIRWVRANAASLHIDPSRIGCMGLSSGAHICAHAALRGSEDQQTHLAAAMLFAPPLTFGLPVLSTWYSLPRNFNLHCCCDRVNATGNCHSCDVVVGTPFEGRLPYCEHEGTYDKPLAVQPGNKYEDFYSSPQLTLLLGASPLAVVAHQTDPDPAWMALNARLRDLDPLARDPGERPLPSFYTIHGKEDFVARYELGGPRLHSALMDLPDADKREDVLVSIEGMGHLVSEEYEPVYRQAVLRGMQWFEERLLQARAAEPTHKKKKKKKKKKFCEAAKSKKACKKVKGCSFTKKKGCRAICKAAKSKKACKKVKGCSFTKKKGCRAI